MEKYLIKKRKCIEGNRGGVAVDHESKRKCVEGTAGKATVITVESESSRPQTSMESKKKMK